MFDNLDANGSGVLEPEEIENSRMRFMIDRMDLDTSRGISRDDLSAGFDRMRERFEENGGFGRSGFGGWGGSRDRGDDDRSDDDRGSWRSRWGRDDDRENSSSGRSGRDRDDRGRGDRNNSRTPKKEPPPRVTVDMPGEFAAGDADHDGQIGLYEWTQWKSRAALGQFLGLDRDGDGFLTPRELTHSAEAKPVDVATFFQPSPALQVTPPSATLSTAPSTPEASSAATPTPQVSSPRSGTPESPASVVSTRPALIVNDPQAVIAAADQGKVKQAERYFSLLDQNRDGSISESEWTNSRKLKPLFEQAGVDLAQPMSSDTFVSYYVRISAADESI
jgi:hypothetical protein